jgi:tRNA(fMet)-specific endonuclease VapC
MLDTNICIYLLKRISKVVSVFSEKQNDGAAISSITLAELEFGVWNSKAYDTNREALITFLPLVAVLPFDSAAAAEYGKICALLRQKGAAIGPLDMLIAAHAQSQGLIVVTNNTREFARVEGLHLENWVKP